MKILSLLVSIITTISIAYFSYINVNHNSILMCPFQCTDIEISIAHLIFIIFAAGAIAGFTFASFYLTKKIDALIPFKRRCEKLSVQNDSDDTRLKSLEAKIKTLEIALNNALNKD